MCVHVWRERRIKCRNMKRNMLSYSVRINKMIYHIRLKRRKVKDIRKSNKLTNSYPTHCRCIVSPQAIITKVCCPSVYKIIIQGIRLGIRWWLFGFIHEIRNTGGNSWINQTSWCTNIVACAIDVNEFGTVKFFRGKPYLKNDTNNTTKWAVMLYRCYTTTTVQGGLLVWCPLLKTQNSASPPLP